MPTKSRWFNSLLAGIFALSLIGARGRSTGPISMGTAMNSKPLLQQVCLDQGRGRSAMDSATGVAQFVSTRAGAPLRVSNDLKGGSAEDVARGFLSRCSTLFGVGDQATDLIASRERQTQDGQRTTVHFQQQYQDIPIVAGELFVQLDVNRDILAVGGEILPKIYLDTNPTVEAAAAQQYAIESVAKYYKLDVAHLTASEPILKIYDAALLEPRDGPTQLVWETEVTAENSYEVRQYVLINAQRGNVVLSFNNVEFAKNRTVYDGSSGNLDANPPVPGTQMCTESSHTSCDTATDQYFEAFVYAGATYDYYFNNFGRDSYDNLGAPINAVTNYPAEDATYCNAFWNGQYMVIDDGCTHNGTDDTIGHELTHAVTDSEANLYYVYQSGSVNESMSDVFGEFIDWSVTAASNNDDTSGVRWQLFEDEAPGDVDNQGPGRDMKDPTLHSQPDKMSSVVYDFSDSYTDHGGVHANSGIGNKAAYLMTDGDTFNSITVTGIGQEKVQAIYYEVLTNLLVSGSDYRDLHDALVQACNNLVGITPVGAGSAIASTDCDEVQNAVDAVEMDQEPTIGFNSEAPICDNPSDVAVDLFSDDIETIIGATYNWNVFAYNNTSNVTDYRHWWATNNNATSGIWTLYGDDYDYDGGDDTSDTYSVMRARITVPAALPNAYLHFNHSFLFEHGSYDGGVVEYSNNGGSNWIDAGSLFYDVNTDYNGTIDASYGNPLGYRNAFVNDSHGYISSRLDLTGLRGQSLLFRWRMATDSSGFNWGWWVDDVKVYSCMSTAPTVFTATYKSVGAYDGWVRESTETSKVGGALSPSTKLQVGDSSLDEQYRSIVSFNTAALPNTAVILAATLSVKKASQVGSGNLFSSLGDLLVDARVTKFSSLLNLQAGDFQTTANVSGVSPFSPYISGGWYKANVSGASNYISRTATTQFRLRFAKDDNDNHLNNYLVFQPGEIAAYAPKLVIQYYVP